MTFEDGIHYLKTIKLPFFDSKLLILWSILSFIILILCTIIFKKYAKYDTIQSTSLLFAIALSLFLILFWFNPIQETYDAYQLFIDDNISFNSISEKYKIIDVDENVVTIMEKDGE